MVLLAMFPCIILGMLWVFLCIFGWDVVYDDYGQEQYVFDAFVPTSMWIEWAPWALGAMVVWLLIAYFWNVKIIQMATGAKPLTRKENPRIYNIVENLTMTCGMDMPQINIIEDEGLNAFASGINRKTYTVTLTRGIINYLSDEELAGVIGHELTHIRNNDTKLLIISIVFVGIISTVLNILTRVVLRAFLYSGSSYRSSRSNKKGGGGAAIVVVIIAAIVCAAIAYFLTLLTRFAISRKREYMADAGGAELCGNPWALASALRKIAGYPGLGSVERDDVAQLFIIHPKKLKQSFFDSLNNIFSTHPPIKERIRILEQF